LVDNKKYWAKVEKNVFPTTKNNPSVKITEGLFFVMKGFYTEGVLFRLKILFLIASKINKVLPTTSITT
jgi:DNA/RNA endonuclease G (NUC1)